MSAIPETTNPELEGLGRYEFGWHDPDLAGATAQRGLSQAVVRDISSLKDEPRVDAGPPLKGQRLFGKKPMPTWGSDLSRHRLRQHQVLRPLHPAAGHLTGLTCRTTSRTLRRLGIPEAEKQRLIAGVAAQYESEVIYRQIREDLEEQGVLFLDTDTALRRPRTSHNMCSTRSRSCYVIRLIHCRIMGIYADLLTAISTLRILWLV